MSHCPGPRNVRGAAGWITAFTFALLLTACGGGADSSASLDDGPTFAPETHTGYFYDEGVSGASYVSCDANQKHCISDETGEHGDFQCYPEGETTFSVSNIEFGKTAFTSEKNACSADVPAVVTPYVLTGDEQAATDMTRLLMSMDEDNDPGNGISISDDTKQVVSNVVASKSSFSVIDSDDVLSALRDSGHAIAHAAHISPRHFTVLLNKFGIIVRYFCCGLANDDEVHDHRLLSALVA